jgi:hypothetical protein
MSIRRNIFLGVKQWFAGRNNFPTNVIVTSPHGSSKVPLSVFPYLRPDYQTSSRLLLNFSDYGTKYLLEKVPLSQQVVARYGRIVGDANRKRDDEDVIRFEDFNGVPIFREKFQKRLTTSWLRPFWLRKLLLHSYEPFYRDVFSAIDAAAQNPANEGRPIILLDVHDTGNRLLGRTWREDKARKIKKMPPLVLSNAPDLEVDEGRFGTAPEAFLLDFREKIADKLGLEEKEIEINSIFKGANVIRYFGNPSANRRLRKILRGKDIYAVQVEFDRALYLDEVTQRPIGWKVASVRNCFMETIVEMNEMLD